MRKSILLAVAVGVAGLFVSKAHAVVGNWIGPTQTNWSESLSWQDGIIPNGQGHTAQYIDNNGSMVSLVDVLGGIRVGTLKVAATTNISWQIRPVNDVIMDQDGAGPMRASIINDIQSTTTTGNPAIFVNNNTGWLVLNDDLFISNTSNSTRTSGAVQMQTKISGAGNIWIENVSNDIGHAQVVFSGQGNFAGHTTIAKGAVTFTRGDVFSPSPGNFVTIGSEGGGDATLAAVGGGHGAMENNFVAAANSGGTLVFASRPSNDSNMNIKSTNTNAALIRLDGDLTFDNRADNGSVFVIGNQITGVGKLTKVGVGLVRLTHTNSYQGGTVVNEGSLSVGWAPDTPSPFGFHAATVGALGPGDVTVNSTATKLEIETGASADAISNFATVHLAGCDSAFGCTGGIFGVADGGYLELGAGINEVVGALLLSTDGGLNYVAQAPGTYGATGSGATNIMDEYFAGSGILTVLPGTTPGDHNEDGIVDAADYVLWRKSPTTHGGAAGYTSFYENFGMNTMGGNGGNQGVPEPNALLLVMAGALLMCVRRQNH